MTTSTCQSNQPKPCKKHGVVERFKNGDCKECHKIVVKNWQKNNVLKARNDSKKWRENNLQRKKATDKAWKEANHNKVLEIQRRSYFNNREASKKACEKWRKENPEKNKDRIKKWRIDNAYADCIIKGAIQKHKYFLLGGLKATDIPQELVDLKRLQMKLHHAIKQREKLEKVL